MRQFKKPPQKGGIIILRQSEKHEWVFELPRLTTEVDDRLECGIDWMQANLKRAEAVFRKLIHDYPEHIDAYHHLALALEKMGKGEEAFRIWERAVKMALGFFPPHFSMQKDRLQWGFVENRPFLRLYNGYGWKLMKKGQTEEALEVFENMLAMNPHDNQGVRGLVVNCHLELNEPAGVLSVCRQYPNDAMEQLVYGRALAYFQLGKMKQTAKALKLAIKCFPLIAQELLKAKHPRPEDCDEQYITMGSAAQAYLYWKEQGKYWTAIPGALEFLRNQLSKGTSNR
jgi:tetratricopeptide (TPR) repeat protein